MKNNLWAPWRMKYIQKIDKKGCIFCDKMKKKDKDALIIKRKKYCFSILNIYPYNNGHLMVAPNRHVGKLELLKEKELIELIMLVNESQKLIKKRMKPHGLNIGLNLGRVAGAGVEDHLHFHIVPRWNGDTNFMPVIGNTKVVSQSLKDTYELLKK